MTLYLGIDGGGTRCRPRPADRWRPARILGRRQSPAPPTSRSGIDDRQHRDPRRRARARRAGLPEHGLIPQTQAGLGLAGANVPALPAASRDAVRLRDRCRRDRRRDRLPGRAWRPGRRHRHPRHRLARLRHRRRQVEHASAAGASRCRTTGSRRPPRPRRARAAMLAFDGLGTGDAALRGGDRRFDGDPRRRGLRSKTASPATTAPSRRWSSSMPDRRPSRQPPSRRAPGRSSPCSTASSRSARGAIAPDGRAGRAAPRPRCQRFAPPSRRRRSAMRWAALWRWLAARGSAMREPRRRHCSARRSPRRRRSGAALSAAQEEIRGAVSAAASGRAMRCPPSATSPKAQVSRVTVRKAVPDLVKGGLLRQRQGSGTFVAPPPQRVEQALSRLTSFTEDMALRGIAPTFALARPRHLARLARGDDGAVPVVERMVARVARLRIANDTPLAIERATHPDALSCPIRAGRPSLYASLAAPATARCARCSAFPPPISATPRTRPARGAARRRRPRTSNAFPILETGKVIEFTHSMVPRRRL